MDQRVDALLLKLSEGRVIPVITIIIVIILIFCSTVISLLSWTSFDSAPREKSLPIPVQAAEVLRQELGVLQGHLKRAKIMFMMMVVVWEMLSMVTLLTFLTLY